MSDVVFESNTKTGTILSARLGGGLRRGRKTAPLWGCSEGHGGVEMAGHGGTKDAVRGSAAAYGPANACGSAVGRPILGGRQLLQNDRDGRQTVRDG